MIRRVAILLVIVGTVLMVGSVWMLFGLPTAALVFGMLLLVAGVTSLD